MSKKSDVLIDALVTIVKLETKGKRNPKLHLTVDEARFHLSDYISRLERSHELLMVELAEFEYRFTDKEL